MSVCWEGKLPNGHDMRGYDKDVEVLELLYAPRPLLDRRPKQPFLQGLAIGLFISVVIFALAYMVMLRTC